MYEKNNQIYYFKIGKGKWEGSFSFVIQDWKHYWEDKLPLKYRILTLIMVAVERLFGASKIYSEILAFPERGKCGVASNRVVIKKFRIPIYVLKEEYILYLNGSDVNVRSIERFGPIPLLFQHNKQHPAVIGNGGLKATYYMPLLGTDWVGSYQVLEDGNNIDAELKCSWGEAVEKIRRIGEANNDSLIKVPDGKIEANVNNNLTHKERISKVANRIEIYRNWYDSIKDSRAVFSHAYLKITEIISNSISEGIFDDPEWIVSLDEAFANHYFHALDSYDQNKEVPKAWESVFNVVCQKNCSVIEALLFSMTAHIVYDLPLSLCDVSLTDNKKISHIRDYHKVNDILSDGINTIQEAVINRYNPHLKMLDRLGKGYDEILTNYGFRLGRGMAWYNAKRLLSYQSTDSVLIALTKSISTLIDKLRNPPLWIMRTVFNFYRWLIRFTRRWPKE